MQEESKLLALLQVAVPSDTPVTITSEVKILEILGIVSNPELIRSMQVATALVPPATPATLKGLIQLLTGLMKINPKSTKSHHDTLNTLLAGLEVVPDEPLTFGNFLPICDSLLTASHKRKTHKAA